MNLENWCKTNEKESILTEWDYSQNAVSPAEISYGSHKKAWFVCQWCGYKWNCEIKARTIGKSKCPICAKKIAGKKLQQRKLQVNGSLQENRPDIALEWDYEKNNGITPDDVTFSSHEYAWWKCSDCCNEYRMMVNDRANGQGCPKCRYSKMVQSQNKTHISKHGSLADNNPKLADEWDYERNNGLRPDEVAVNSMKKVWWRCPECLRSYSATVANRNSAKSDCSYCNSENQTSFQEKAILFYLRKAFPDTIETYKPKWIGRSEIDIYIPSLRLGIEYDGKAWHRDIEKDVRKNELCKSNNITLLRIREPSLPILPQCENVINYNIESISKDDSHIVSVIRWIQAFIQHNYGMSTNIEMNVEVDYDTIRREMDYSKKQHSLAMIKPELASQWHPSLNANLSPEKVAITSHKKVWWLCPKCKNEWQAAVSGRVAGNGCPECARIRRIGRKKQKKGLLVEESPKIASEWNRLKNLVAIDKITTGSGRRVWWICGSCGYEWEASVYHRCWRNGNCPSCRRK